MAEKGDIPVSLKKIKRTDKKKDDNLDPNNDEFIAKTTSVFDWAYEHRRLLAVVIVVALVAALVGIFANRYFQNKSANESKLLAAGLEASVARVVVPNADADDGVPKPEAEDDTLTFDSIKARATEALNRWSEAAAKTADLKAIADLGEANAHMDLEEYDKAIAAYKAFLASKPGAVGFLRLQAVEGLGYALEAKGKDAEAKAEFDQLKDSSTGEIKKMATYQSARLAEKTGDRETAKKLYKEVLDNYGENQKPSRFDIVFVQARTRLLTLDPKAQAPDLPAGSGSGLDGLDPRLLQQLMQAQRGAGAS
jgi:tetratricopeptide (TPR) repeat protein